MQYFLPIKDQITPPGTMRRMVFDWQSRMPSLLASGALSMLISSLVLRPTTIESSSIWLKSFGD